MNFIRGGIILFLLSFFLFLSLQIIPAFPDPDSFYHAKMALLIKEQGIIKNFPWLQMSVLSSFFTDHHLLYHFFLIPFLFIGLSPLYGIKLAAALFASLAVAVFFILLQKQGIRGPFWWTLLLLSSIPFIWRMNLAKANSLALLVFLIGLYALLKRRPIILFFISFFYVWLHASWPLILAALLIYVLSDALFFTLRRTSPHRISPINIRDYIKLILACFLGLAAGIILNPYFPQNLTFYYYQIFEIALKGYKTVIEVGKEWGPYDFLSLAAGNALLITVWIAALVFFLRKKESDSNSWFFLMLSVFFFILTLRSARTIELFAPCAVLFCATIFSRFISLQQIRDFSLYLKMLARSRRFAATLLLLYLIFIIPFPVIRGFIQAYSLAQNGFPIGHWSKAGIWLSQNTPRGATVFHTQWDSFPLLFYYNTHNTYLVGLDPVFAYLRNKAAYKAWRKLGSAGDSPEAFYDLFVKTLPAVSYIFVEKGNLTVRGGQSQDIELNARLQLIPQFKKVYEDEEAIVYKGDS
jgi:hypothetical protein